MSEPIYCLEILNLPESLEDEVSEICIARGSQGVARNLKFTQVSLQYNPDIIAEERIHLSAYFSPLPPKENLLLEICSLDSQIQTRVRQEATKDWLEEWKKGFEPFLLAEPFWVVPSWREPQPQMREVLRIDPGMAFGTGTHATTKLATQLIIQLTAREKISSAFDVGTGTGILAMVAHKSGVPRIEGNDIDPEAVRVARENLSLNHLEQVRIVAESIANIAGPYDLVIANIIDGVLMDLRADLLRITREEGFLILTGVLAEREPLFQQKFLNADSCLKVLARVTMDEWVGFLVKKSGELK